MLPPPPKRMKAVKAPSPVVEPKTKKIKSNRILARWDFGLLTEKELALTLKAVPKDEMSTIEIKVLNSMTRLTPLQNSAKHYIR